MRKASLALLFATLAPLSAAPVPDLEVLFLDKHMWSKSVLDVLKDRKALGFSWLSTAKKDARSNRRDLKLWNKPVGETILRSREGKLHSFEISIYNRGDNGALSADAFKKLTEQWQTLVVDQTGLKGEKMNRTQKGSVVSADRWIWKCPGAFLVLTSSKSKPKRGDATPEFLKLSLVSVKFGEEIYEQHSGLVKTMARRRELVENRQEKSNGDVFVHGVPMVDQGRKGYCAVASAERVFRYYGLPIDQHAMAQIAESSARGGTNPDVMIEALKKVAGRTKTRLAVLYETEQRKVAQELKAYNRLIKKNKKGRTFPEGRVHYQSFLSLCHGPTLREVKAKGNGYDRFLKQIRDNIDAGIPILWGLQVGVFPERGIPQSGGGHMRLIIGYNEKTKELIYTDSWGPGHEYKRMSAANAYTVSMHLVTLKPSKT